MSENLVDRIRQRLADTDMNMKEASLAAGLGETFVRDVIARGRSPRSDHLQKLARALGVTSDWLLNGTESVVTTTSGPPSGDAKQFERNPSNASHPVPVDFPNATIGMLGSGSAGVDGRFVLNGQRVMDVLCPPSLINVPNAYGVFVHGTSMVPRYFPGEGVFVNPHRPVRQDDFVVVQVHGGYEGDDSGGYVKQFVSMNSRELVLRQYETREDVPANAPDDDRYTLRFPREYVIAVHKIVWSGEV